MCDKQEMKCIKRLEVIVSRCKTEIDKGRIRQGRTGPFHG